MSESDLQHLFDTGVTEDEELQELISLKAVKKAISEKKRNMRARQFNNKHPLIDLVRNELQRKKGNKEVPKKESVPEPKKVPEPEPKKESVPEPEPEPRHKEVPQPYRRVARNGVIKF